MDSAGQVTEMSTGVTIREASSTWGLSFFLVVWTDYFARVREQAHDLLEFHFTGRSVSVRRMSTYRGAGYSDPYTLRNVAHFAETPLLARTQGRTSNCIFSPATTYCCRVVFQGVFKCAPRRARGRKCFDPRVVRVSPRATIPRTGGRPTR